MQDQVTAAQVTAQVTALTEVLPALGTAERAERERAYLHSEYRHLGVPVPELRRAVTRWRRALPAGDRGTVLALAAALWDSDGTAVYEHRGAAVELLCQSAALLTAADLPGAVAPRLREAGTWALVDPLAVHCAGRVALADPAAGPVLDAWAADGSFWVRRSALLALLPGIRAGAADLARLDRYGAAMAGESEFFIRKALGWVLRELSTRDPDHVRGWVAAHEDRISPLTRREALRRIS